MYSILTNNFLWTSRPEINDYLCTLYELTSQLLYSFGTKHIYKINRITAQRAFGEITQSTRTNGQHNNGFSETMLFVAAQNVNYLR